MSFGNHIWVSKRFDGPEEDRLTNLASHDWQAIVGVHMFSGKDIVECAVCGFTTDEVECEWPCGAEVPKVKLGDRFRLRAQ